MNKRFLIIFIGYFAPLIFGAISCNKWINDCGPFPDKYKVKSLKWNIYKAKYSMNADPRLVLSEITEDSIIYNEYSIHIYNEAEEYFSLGNKTNSFGFINFAYACSPKYPSTDESIKDIQIYCNKDYNSNHTAGTNLADLFDIVVFYPYNQLYEEKFDLSDYLATFPPVPNQMTFILRDPPAFTNEFEFRVEYYLEGIDHDYFEHKTRRVIIRTE